MAPITGTRTSPPAAALAELLRSAPLVDGERVRTLWEAARGLYNPANWVLPLPIWRLAPYDHAGPRAWEVLRPELAAANAAGSSRPMCIYLHVPFCRSKCGFCDSYSFALRSHQADRIKSYVERLCAELELWSRQGDLGERPVSTVHLGGGTPSFLGAAGLARIVNTCRRHFAITERTEWALESTARELTPALLTFLHSAGFRRLHLGVQSLEDPVRQVIGRSAPAAEAVAALEAALELGWVVSVDMICGLPGQSLAGLVGDLERLLRLGVNGFSLYELLIYRQNRRWAEGLGLADPARHLPNYWTFLAAADLLERNGLSANVFNHWADGTDRNVYFTFPTRGEDLLAVGAIADGVFGDYHYRHPGYAPYMAGELPGLEGGLRRPAAAARLQPVVTAILAGSLAAAELALLRGVPGGPELLGRWAGAGLVEPAGAGAGSAAARGGAGGTESVRLTPSGSWFAGTMVQELGALSGAAG